MKVFALLALLAASALTAATHPAVSFVVIVNAANPVTPSAEDLASVFMKRITRWDVDAMPIVVVDGSPDSRVRQEFTRVILHRNVDMMEAYWQQQIFSGRDVPPVEKESDAEVLAFVRRHPGAIGYVSPSAPLDGVRVVFWR